MASQIRQHKLNASTFAPERFHKKGKSIANRMFHKTIHTCTLQLVVRHICQTWASENLLTPTRLLEPCSTAPHWLRGLAVKIFVTVDATTRVLVSSRCHQKNNR